MILNHNSNQDCIDSNDATDNSECTDFYDDSMDDSNPGQDGPSDDLGGNEASGGAEETSEVGVFGLLVVLLIAGMIIGIIVISRSEEESSDE